MSDEQKLADAFIVIYRAAMVISEVLGENDALNESIPTNWPLNLSADEFAAECWGMAEHYQSLVETGRYADILAILAKNNGACLYWQMPDVKRGREALRAGVVKDDGDLLVHPDAIQIEAGMAYTMKS